MSLFRYTGCHHGIARIGNRTRNKVKLFYLFFSYPNFYYAFSSENLLISIADPDPQWKIYHYQHKKFDISLKGHHKSGPYPYWPGSSDLDPDLVADPEHCFSLLSSWYFFTWYSVLRIRIFYIPIRIRIQQFDNIQIRIQERQ